VLEMRETAMPQPDRQAVAAARACGFAHRGEFVAGNACTGQPGSWKAIGGEGAGEVVSVGAGVTGFRPATA
jgi:NADPH:quinone reductase-like Zn-dependent oxidoreductase